MKCYYCQGEMENTLDNYMSDVGGRFIIIKKVPCHKCRQCGEVSYSAEVVEKLEQIIADLKKYYTEIAIIEYAA